MVRTEDMLDDIYKKIKAYQFTGGRTEHNYTSLFVRLIVQSLLIRTRQSSPHLDPHREPD